LAFYNYLAVIRFCNLIHVLFVFIYIIIRLICNKNISIQLCSNSNITNQRLSSRKRFYDASRLRTIRRKALLKLIHKLGKPIIHRLLSTENNHCDPEASIIIPTLDLGTYTIYWVIVIVISRLLKRNLKAKCTRAPAYSRALGRIKGVPKGESREAQVRFPEVQEGTE